MSESAIAAGRFDPPARPAVVYGTPLATALPEALAAVGAARAVVVTNTSLSGPDGLAARVADLLGGGHRATVAGVGQGTPRADVLRVVAALADADAVVAVGGGSVVEAAKAARLCVANDVRDERGIDRLLADGAAAPPHPALVAVPTTLSGAEFTRFAGVTNPETGGKDAIHHADLAPDTVILDPAAARTAPDSLWFATGLRALDHAVETWLSRAPAPYGDATALYAARLLAGGLPQAHRDPADDDARLVCQTGAWMAIQGAVAGVPHGASHGIGAALTAVTGMPHGVTSCIMLAHVARYNAPDSGTRQAALAQAMGRPDVPLGDAIAELVALLHLPGRLRDAGVARDWLPAVARAAIANPRLAGNIRAIPDEATVADILDAAF